MTTILNDIKYAFRQLRNSPGFMAVAVLTLALGIGACTVVFSLINTVMLRPLPFRKLDRLVSVWQTDQSEGNQRQMASYPNVDPMEALRYE